MADTGEANHLVLVARIAALSALRYTPAGLAALDLELEHDSQQTDADTPRTVRLTLKAVAFGEMTRRLLAIDTSQLVRFNGFLVSPRLGKSVTFHVQDFKTL
jgi:primosomal replication protein N